MATISENITYLKNTSRFPKLTKTEVTQPTYQISSAEYNAIVNALYDCGTWINAKKSGEAQSEADALFDVTTSATNLVFYADTTTSANMSATVTVKCYFDGSQVGVSVTPGGWTNTNNTYTRTISGAGATCAARNWQYIVSGGDYDGLTVSKSSEANTISAVYPAWYGFVDDTDESMAGDFASSMTRLASALTGTHTLTNNTSGTAYLMILTKGTATATQLGLSILGSQLNADDFVSPNNSAITLGGYHVYYSSKPVAAGGSLDNVVLNISLA